MDGQEQHVETVQQSNSDSGLPATLNPGVQEFQLDMSNPVAFTQSAPASPDRSTFDTGSKEAQLRQHLSYYFSELNLIKDVYLVSRMTPEFYVPCSLIAQFPAVKKLTNDINLVVELLRSLPNVVQVTPDGAMVRPVMIPPGLGSGGAMAPPVAIPPDNTPQNTTIIIHDSVPPDTPVDDVKVLFADGPTPISVSLEANNTWSIDFENEEAAHQALRAVSSKHYRDVPINAQLKIQVPRGNPPYGPGFNAQRFQQQGYFDPMAQYGGYGYMPMYGYPYMYNMPFGPGRPPQDHGIFNQGPMYGPTAQRQQRQNTGSKKSKGDKNHKRTNSEGSDMSSSSGGGSVRKGGRSGGGRGESFGSRKKGPKSNADSQKKRKDVGKQSAPPLVPENFPALPGGQSKSMGEADVKLDGAKSSAGSVQSGWGSKKIADIVRGGDQTKPSSASVKGGGEGADTASASTSADPRVTDVESVNKVQIDTSTTNPGRDNMHSDTAENSKSRTDGSSTGDAKPPSIQDMGNEMAGSVVAPTAPSVGAAPAGRSSSNVKSESGLAKMKTWGGKSQFGTTVADVVAGKAVVASKQSSKHTKSESNNKAPAKSSSTRAANGTNGRTATGSIQGGSDRKSDRATSGSKAGSGGIEPASDASRSQQKATPWAKPTKSSGKPTFADMLRKKEQGL